MNEQTIVVPAGRIIQRPDIQSGPRKRSFEKLRQFWTGVVKSGKSSIAASIPNGYTLDFEDKHEHVAWAKKYSRPASYKEYKQCVEWLIQEGAANRHPYNPIIYDTVDELVQGLLIPGITEDLKLKFPQALAAFQDVRDYGSGGSKGSKGWDIINTMVAQHLSMLHRVGYGWIVIGHTVEEEVPIPGQAGKTRVRFRPAVNAGIYKAIFRGAEIIGGLSFKTKSVMEMTQLRLSDGRVIDQPKEKLTRVNVLSIREKSADSDEIGSNVSLPDEIEIPPGQGWEVVKAAYDAGGTVEKSK